MKNRLLALFAALAISGACYVLLAGLTDRGWPFEDVLLLAVASTLGLAALAAAFGYRAWQRSFEIRAEFRRLAASVDMAFRELARHGRNETLSLTDIDAHIALEIERLAGRLRMHPPATHLAVPDEPAMQGTNVVPHPATRRGRRDAVANEPAQEIATAHAQLIHRVLASGEVDLSLQPIISVARGAAAGFEVYAHLGLGDGRSVHLRRAVDIVNAPQEAAFERCLVVAAAQAVRRRLGDAGGTMPLHVAVSARLIDDDAELSAVLDLFRQYPALTPSLVLSLPDELFEAGGAGLERLSSAGIRLAAEGVKCPAPVLGKHGVAFVKLPAGTLLDPATSGAASRDAERLLEASTAAGIELIVTGVARDEEAVRLIDLGVDLMSGPRFSGPKLLRAQSTARAGRVSTLPDQPPATSAG